MSVPMVEPIRKHIVIEAPQDHVWHVFTNGIDKWWPRQHHIGASPLKEALIEPRQGGRWYSTCEDGSQCDIGKVLAWNPPHSLVLAWQITANWQYDPDFVTEVEVTFTAEGPRTTRVDLEHRQLHRYGIVAGQTRTALDAEGGWTFIMSEFARVAEASVA